MESRIEKTKKKISKNNTEGNFSFEDEGKVNLKKKEKILNKSSNAVLKIKLLGNIIKNELEYISNLFAVSDIENLKHGGRNVNEDYDDIGRLEVLNIPEKKSYKKHGSKKGAGQTSRKSFPKTIEGLEKELEEIKGTPMTYVRKLRKKGLQARLVKKKRREEKRYQKAELKQGKKNMIALNGRMKAIKPVFNNNGDIVSNKFDFVDSEVKKRKPSSETNLINNEVNNHLTKNRSHLIKSFHETSPVNSSFESNEHISKPTVKKESVVNIVDGESKPVIPHGPIFNKDNKMVFSKVLIPENNKSGHHKKKGNKDPKKILQQIKESSKKISELEKEDKDKAMSLKEKQKWAAALKRASGEKVKDDPELLRKTIMKEKNKKMRSQKKWNARIEHVQKEKDERQKKRTENIQARKNEKKKKKMKKAIKKGSYVPL